MLRLSDSWVWDFWLADTGEEYHLFFLRASRALGDPHRRHGRASVGHAVSTDLQAWTLLPDALVHSDGPAFDDMATWTGSVLRAPDGTWRMFYTGLTRSEGGQIQRIGSATSSDLTTWTPDPGMTPLSADARWYEKLGGSSWQGEAWRDPWVFADPGGDGWHMLVTARAVTGDDDDRGVIGHATSPDLQHWTAREPLSRPGAGFGQLEVLQVAEVEGHPVVLFSCLHGELSAASRERWASGGVWALPVDSVVGPFDPSGARLLTDHRLYVGRLVRDRAGRSVLLAFHHDDAHGDFVGEISDPMPVQWQVPDDGTRRLVLEDEQLRPAGDVDPVPVPLSPSGG
jgi:beta-fructofuranosidase